MKKFTMFACLALTLAFALSSFAGELPRMTRGNSMIHGGSTNFAKAGGDTLTLMATAADPTNTTNPACVMPGFDPDEPYYRGDFEMGTHKGLITTDGSGWTSYDITQPSGSHWNVSNYDGHSTFPNLRAWCGADIVSCGGTDPDGGYGNSWHDLIEFTVAVDYYSTNVVVTANLQHDSEPGYDYTYMSYRFEGNPIADMVGGVWDGESGTTPGTPTPIAVSGSVTYLPQELIDGTHIVVYFRFKSDGGWSDEDCSYPSAGGCQVDDIDVAVTNNGTTTHYTENFDTGVDLSDPDNGTWHLAFPTGVGDFTRIWEGLSDDDPCTNNDTKQVAFIDDGEVIPGTGGSDCINWCYGDGGFIVTTTGGLAGPTEHIHNAIESPAMEWPHAKDCVSPDPDGILFTFGVYSHEDLTADSPGIFYTWGIRSADIDDSAGNGAQVLSEQGWQHRNFVYYGGPYYIRGGNDVTDLMNPGRDEVQVQLTVYELGWAWYWTGNDGYPAPYFDNVTVKIFPYNGPGMAARELDLAQDNFPEQEFIDITDLTTHSVRFDSANNISLPSHLRNDPGDSVVVDIVPVRTGAVFVGLPTLHWKLDPNPVFTVTNGSRTNSDVEGAEVAMPAVGISGDVTPDKWAFDLPDTGFLFPGDVLHYYISATDIVGTDAQTSLMPADTTGYSTGFGDPMGYHSTFVIHALPSLCSVMADRMAQPGILFINDFANRGGENVWYTALRCVGMKLGRDYDVYYVNGPSSGVGNGIGGRATVDHLTGDPVNLMEGYRDILYTCGNLSVNTIANGDFQNDAGDDVGVLMAWLDFAGIDKLGNNIFLTGDDLASDMAQAGENTGIFLEDYMGLFVDNSNIRPLIDKQITPMVAAVPAPPSNPVFSLERWIPYGGCFSINTFDAVQPVGTGVRIAEFLDVAGNGGAYAFSAATLNTGIGAAGTSKAVSMPYDLMYIYPDPDLGPAGMPASAWVLMDVLTYFGVPLDPPVGSPAPLPGIAFETSNHPNPFNPSTTIKYSMPKAGHLKLSIYNVRGQLVKSLIDGNRPAGADQTIVWDGTNNQGSSVSSGVYFYEARTNGEVQVQKMALVK